MYNETSTTRYQQNLNILSQFKNGNIEKELLKNYSGWGGLRKVVHQPEVYNQLKKVLTDDEIVSLKNTLSSAYYTPKEIVTFMYDFLSNIGFSGGAILEPAVGHGVFLEHMPEDIKKASRIDCVEIDKVTSDICKTLYPDIRLYTRSFENFNPSPRYDLIIGNPPYGAQTVCDANHADLNDYRIHHYFVAKSMRLLNEGGILAMVLPQYFLDNESKHVRDIIENEGGELIAAYRLPDDLFSDAKVTVDIVFLRKGKAGKKPHALPWTKTPKIFINGHHKSLALNEYFQSHKHHIIGNLTVTDIYGKNGLTCRKNGNDTFKILQNLIEPKTETAKQEKTEKIITGFQKQINELNQKFNEFTESAHKIFLEIQGLSQKITEVSPA
jgi:type I restriction-modification system DNA methylase subunit